METIAQGIIVGTGIVGCAVLTTGILFVWLEWTTSGHWTRFFTAFLPALLSALYLLIH